MKEENDKLEKIYTSGFLPFRNKLNLFYLARSCRVDLDKFSLLSENRRILKKTADLNFAIKKMADFNYTPQVQKQCKDWAKSRGWKISTKSLKFIFSNQFFNYLFVWEKRGQVVGYQIFYQAKNFIHSAYVIYNSVQVGKELAMRMLIEGSLWGQKNNQALHYLGTSYGGSGFSKRSLAGFEFFNGFGWSDNLEEWKYLDSRKKDDYLLRDQEYLEQFWPEGKLNQILKAKGVSFKK